MPQARGSALVKRDPPETRRLQAANEEDGRTPLIDAGRRPADVDPAYAFNSAPFGTTPVST